MADIDPDVRCRACGHPLSHTFADLGMSPLSNSYLAAEQLHRPEPFYPLHARVCERCFLVQLEEFESPAAIFSDYAYFSSYSDSWLAHARRYCKDMTRRYGLDASRQVIEIASNDGYLLQFFQAAGIPVLGIEPAANVAAVATGRGIPTRVQFHGEATAAALAAEGMRADLLLGNNVLAHVPDINDFARGLRYLLKPAGTVTLEFPHLLELMRNNQFDTIYHEHFSYLSLLAVERILAAAGLRVCDVEKLPTHGGSLRLHACHAGDGRAAGPALAALRAEEAAAGLDRIDSYTAFGERVRETKRALLEFLIAARRAGKSIAAYGAAAKGNTLLNYCGIRNDFIDYVADRSPHKQGRFLPGTHLPILAPEAVARTRPDYLLILPWNLRDEVMAQMAHIRDWGGRFVVPIPRVEVLA